MARGRKPKAEIEEIVEEVIDQPIAEADEVATDTVDAIEVAATEEPIEESAPVENEISSESTVTEMAEIPVEEKPKRQRKKKETKPETKDNETDNEIIKEDNEINEEPKVEFNPDIPLQADSIRTKITVKNFTTIYRDENLTYPYARIYGDVTLIDFVSPKILKVKAMFNGRLVVGYIGRGSVN